MKTKRKANVNLLNFLIFILGVLVASEVLHSDCGKMIYTSPTLKDLMFYLKYIYCVATTSAVTPLSLQ